MIENARPRTVQVTDPRTGRPVVLDLRKHRLRTSRKPPAFVRAVIAAMADEAVRDGAMSVEGIDRALGRCADGWVKTMALCCGWKPDFVAGLSDAEGERLSDAVLEVNRHYLVWHIGARAMRRARRNPAALTRFTRG